MMQSPVYEIIHVVTVRYKLMAAVDIMFAAAINMFLLNRVCLADRNSAFIPMTVVLMVQMAFMYVVYMVTMLYFGMPASNTVFVFMITMSMMLHSNHFLSKILISFTSFAKNNLNYFGSVILVHHNKS
jgi:hypothetical protein